MLKTGLSLLAAASLGVIYRAAHLPYSTYPCCKWICLSGLCVSLACFISTYLLADVRIVE